MHAKTTSCLLLSVLCACAGTRGVAPGPAAPSAAIRDAAPAPREAPVPADALALVPADASLVATVDVVELAASKSFPTWRGWAQEHSCLRSDDLTWLTGQSARIVFAGRSTANQPVDLLVLLQGKYGANDVERALDLLADQDRGATAKPRSHRMHGRFSVTDAGLLSAAQLDEHLLILGSGRWLDASLDLISFEAHPRWLDGSATRALAERIDCQHKTVCAQVQPSGPTAEVVEAELGAVGAPSLGHNVSHAPLALALDAKAGLRLAVAMQLGSAEQADSVVKLVNDWLWQVGVFAHLAGFPDVLDAAKVRAQAEVAQLDFPIGQDDLESIEKRVAGMLQGMDPPQCKAPAKQAGPAP
ncbi:MAG TPA: hypothetical protein VF331_18410 [Polyangiales bacterium]